MRSRRERSRATVKRKVGKPNGNAATAGWHYCFGAGECDTALLCKRVQTCNGLLLEVIVGLQCKALHTFSVRGALNHVNVSNEYLPGRCVKVQVSAEFGRCSDKMTAVPLRSE